MKNSPEYWEKRIANQTWKVYNSLEEKNKALIEFYQEASRQIRMELYELAEQISEDGIISRTEMYTQQRLQKLEKRYRDIAYDLGQQVEQTEKENMQQGFQEVYENTSKQLEVSDFAIPNRKLMEKLMQEPWRGGNFSSRLWTNQKRLVSAISAILTTGLQQGKSVTNMAVELNMAMGKGFNEAHRLVRTETMHYLNCAALQSYMDADIKKVQFWAAEDERTCETCGAMHREIYNIDKAPVLPIHPNCRCTYLPVIEEEYISNQGANEPFVYQNEPVYYDEKNNYNIDVDGVSKEVCKGLSKAAQEVAKKGSTDRCEHMHLVNLSTGELEYYETNGEAGSVGIDFWKYVEAHPDREFAFVHNHNIVSSLSEADLITPLIYKNIPIQIAVQNDGVKYVVVRTKQPPGSFYPDFYYEKELDHLNQQSRSGKITPVERALKREQIIVESILKEFYGKGVQVLDGRKNKDWATPGMKEYVFWRNGMSPEEFEKEREYYFRSLNERKMAEYEPLWKKRG